MFSRNEEEKQTMNPCPYYSNNEHKCVYLTGAKKMFCPYKHMEKCPRFQQWVDNLDKFKKNCPTLAGTPVAQSKTSTWDKIKQEFRL